MLYTTYLKNNLLGKLLPRSYVLTFPTAFINEPDKNQTVESESLVRKDNKD